MLTAVYPYLMYIMYIWDLLKTLWGVTMNDQNLLAAVDNFLYLGSTLSWVVHIDAEMLLCAANLKAPWSIKLLNKLFSLSLSLFFLVPWTIYYKMHILFFKKVLLILRQCTKHANFWSRVSSPLKIQPLNS